MERQDYSYKGLSVSVCLYLLDLFTELEDVNNTSLAILYINIDLL